jgi:DNA-directed RNA polymerase II subunit RPB1
VLESDCVDLKTVMCIEGVDFKCAYSNNCIEVFSVLGIEAAREAIFKEFDGSKVNYRHLALFCDVMTHRNTTNLPRIEL